MSPFFCAQQQNRVLIYVTQTVSGPILFSMPKKKVPEKTDGLYVPRTLEEAIVYYANEDTPLNTPSPCAGLQASSVRDATRRKIALSRRGKSGAAKAARNSSPSVSERSSRTRLSASASGLPESGC